MTEELKQLREALRRVKYEAVSLADAQVIALEALIAAQPAQEQAQQPLTDEQISKLFDLAETSIYFAVREYNRHLEIYSFGVKDAEAYHGITNTKEN